MRHLGEYISVEETKRRWPRIWSAIERHIAKRFGTAAVPELPSALVSLTGDYPDYETAHPDRTTIVLTGQKTGTKIYCVVNNANLRVHDD